MVHKFNTRIYNYETVNTNMKYMKSELLNETFKKIISYIK